MCDMGRLLNKQHFGGRMWNKKMITEKKKKSFNAYFQPPMHLFLTLIKKYLRIQEVKVQKLKTGSLFS